MTARVLAIGDVHGCNAALETLIRRVGVTPADTVVFLGDLIDRGPDSRGVLERVIRLSAEANVISIRGNHEDMLLQSLERGSPRMFWIGAGASATLNSYGGEMEMIPRSHIEFVQSMHRYWQNETHIFVHANVDADVALEDQLDVWLRWQALTGEEIRHCSGKTVICGHTALADGYPAYADGFICIDTKAYAGQWLTCLDTTNELVWQANEQGHFRGPLPLREIGLPFSRAFL